MAPGDALFFHPNLLHRSDQNHSEHDRWALICCYNARSNSPYKEGRHPAYTPLVRLEPGAVMAFNPTLTRGGTDSFVSNAVDRETQTISGR